MCTRDWQHGRTTEMLAIVGRKLLWAKIIRIEAGQYFGGRQKAFKNILTEIGGSQITLICYLMRMVTSQTGMQARQGHLTLFLSLTLEIDPGGPRDITQMTASTF